MGRRTGVKNGMGRVEMARQKENARLMVGVGLVAHLQNFKREILAEDASKLSEFQEFIQYASPALKMKLLND